MEGQQGKLRLSYAKDRQLDLRGSVPQSSAALDALQASTSLAWCGWLGCAGLLLPHGCELQPLEMFEMVDQCQGDIPGTLRGGRHPFTLSALAGYACFQSLQPRMLCSRH